MASKLAARIIAHGAKRPITAGSPDLRATLPDREADGTLTVLMSVSDGQHEGEAPFTVEDFRGFALNVLRSAKKREGIELSQSEEAMGCRYVYEKTCTRVGAGDEEEECFPITDLRTDDVIAILVDTTDEAAALVVKAMNFQDDLMVNSGLLPLVKKLVEGLDDLGFRHPDEDVNGGDLVQYIGSCLPALRAEVAKGA